LESLVQIVTAIVVNGLWSALPSFFIWRRTKSIFLSILCGIGTYIFPVLLSVLIITSISSGTDSGGAILSMIVGVTIGWSFAIYLPIAIHRSSTKNANQQAPAT
jgi:hypothetical protein